MDSPDNVPAKVRLARAYVRYSPVQLGKDWLWERLRWRRFRTRVRTRFGMDMECYTGSAVGRSVYYFGMWEPNLTHWVRNSLSPGDVFVDVGAHVGYYTLVAGRIVGDDGQVVAVEASRSTCRTLRRNVAMNALGNVDCVNAAAAAQRGSVELRGHHDDTARAGVRQKEGRPSLGAVDAVPVQELVDERDWSRTRLVKIDVEGYEPRVVAGMRRLIAGCRADCEFLVELTPERYEDGELQKMLATFAAQGFRPHEIVNPYSDDYYLARRTDFGARRVADPDRIASPMDVVFSRREAEHLPPTSRAGIAEAGRQGASTRGQLDPAGSRSAR
jgi:FkbM family methyltransferase